MSVFSSFYKHRNFGLLVLRIGLGACMLLLHGLPKMMGGPEVWEKVGSAMGNIGITFFPIIWGFMAALVETVGGLFLIIGLWYRPVTILLFFTMVVAALNHLYGGDGVKVASHSMELAFVFFGLTFIGPGKYSVDKS